jgi:hypothetical protein
MASFSVLIGSIFSAENACSNLVESFGSFELNPLSNAVKNINERLNAATEITGAKTIPITLLILRYSSSFPNFRKSENDSLRIINGEATINNHNNHILAIKTIASARSGKNRAKATQVLMINTHDVSPTEVMSVSVSCAKLSNEE